MYIIQYRQTGTLDEWRSDSIGEQNEFESREYRIAWKGVAQ